MIIERSDILEIQDKKRTMFLGVRIVFLFLVAFIVLILSAYYVLSQNFQKLLTNYSLKLVQAMVEQGVTTVEYELESGQKEIALQANSFSTHLKNSQTVEFSSLLFRPDVLRMIYVSKDGSTASDGRQRDIRDRQDVVEAFNGKTAFYGPYFNEENEYVVCYSAPVVQGGDTVGVLSVEKDGYYFCSLIRGIKFVDTGESYIINAEGTDIAVSDPSHISWVNEQYNARELLQEHEDKVTRSVMELEQKGLDGESGIGTYYWDEGLCYLVYEPIPAADWVLLAGLRQEEILSMTQSTLFSSFSKEPILLACVIAFFLLTVIIIFWIILNLKKSTEINRKLEILANYDQLTGLLNRNEYHAAMDSFSSSQHHSLACIYIDVNGLHEINNHLGHQAGDKMLKCTANGLRRNFSQGNIYRIGGDEFVVFCLNQSKQDVLDKLKSLRDGLRIQGYEISTGVEWRDKDLDIEVMVGIAEEAMQQDKERYYLDNGRERQMRTLDQELEKLMSEKQDMDAFLAILASEYKGVYFVNLDKDSVRHLYIPPYFTELLEEADNLFSKALNLYTIRSVAPDYQQQFEKFCSYVYLRAALNDNNSVEFIYQKNDNTWVKLRILKFKAYTIQNKETLWVFSNAKGNFS